MAIVTESLSRAVFEITCIKDIRVMTLTFQGHVTWSMMSSLVSPWAISH